MRPLFSNLALAAATTLTATSLVMFQPRAAVAVDCVSPDCQQVTVDEDVVGGPPSGTVLTITKAPLVESTEQEAARTGALAGGLDSEEKTALRGAWISRLETEMPWWGNAAYAKKVSMLLQNTYVLYGISSLVDDGMDFDDQGIAWKNIEMGVCFKGACGYWSAADFATVDPTGADLPEDIFAATPWARVSP